MFKILRVVYKRDFENDVMGRLQLGDGSEVGFPALFNHEDAVRFVEILNANRSSEDKDDDVEYYVKEVVNIDFL